MLLYPINEPDFNQFERYLQIETALTCSVDDFMYMLHDAALMPETTQTRVHSVSSYGNQDNAYRINAYISYPSGDNHLLTNRMQAHGIVAVTSKERRPRPAEKKTVLDLIDVFNRIKLSEHFSFRSVIVPQSLFIPLFESNDEYLIKGIDSLPYVSSHYLSSLLTFAYSAFRPRQSNISKTSLADRKTFIGLIISILKEHKEYLGKDEMNAFTKLLINDFGAPMKTALINLLKKEPSFDSKYIATVFASKSAFPRSDKGVISFFDYLSNFDGLDIQNLLIAEIGSKYSTPRNAKQTVFSSIIDSLPESAIGHTLSLFVDLAKTKKIALDRIVHRSIELLWQGEHDNLCNFIGSMTFKEVIDEEGNHPIEGILLNFTNNLSDEKFTAFSDIILDKKKLQRFRTMLLSTTDTYALSFFQKWLNNDEPLPPNFTHWAIECSAIAILDFLAKHPDFDILFKYKINTKTCSWRTVTCLSISDETLDFIAKHLSETGIYDDMGINEFLDDANKSRKNVLGVYEKLNAYLGSSITEGNIEIKSIKHARLYMKIFNVSPLEVMQLTQKDETKHKLLKELVK